MSINPYLETKLRGDALLVLRNRNKNAHHSYRMQLMQRAINRSITTGPPPGRPVCHAVATEVPARRSPVGLSCSQSCRSVARPPEWPRVAEEAACRCNTLGDIVGRLRGRGSGICRSYRGGGEGAAIVARTLWSVYSALVGMVRISRGVSDPVYMSN